MFAGFILLPALMFATFTTLLTFVPDLFENWKFRHHLPLLSGLLIVAFFLVVNPQQEPGSLYWLKSWFHDLLLPLFLFAPLPYLRKWKKIVLTRTSVFFGAAFVADCYFVFLIAGNYYFDDFWRVDGLVWVMSTAVLAFPVFYGLARTERLFLKPGESDSSDGNQGTSPVAGAVLIIWILVFCLPSVFLISLGDTESCGGFEIAQLNQSQVADSPVHHLNEQDFRNFSRMAPYIRDNKTSPGSCFGPGNEGKICVGSGGFRCNEGAQFHQYEDSILEYQGRYYVMSQRYIV